LIADDSPLARAALSSVLGDDPEIEVVGTAKDGYDCVSKAASLKPDVITMDLKMPSMDGLEAIEKIMQENPIPIIVVSSLDEEVIVKALGIGAMDFVAITQEIDVIANELVEKVKTASHVKPLRRLKIKPISICRSFSGGIAPKAIVVGVSTGGPQALQVFFSALPENMSCGILVVQHMSEGFLHGLVSWLQSFSLLKLKVAEDGDFLEKGSALFAPDNFHMCVGKDRRITLKEDDAGKSRYCPSIDETMISVADVFGSGSVGVIMTGMGSDGVAGMKAIKNTGGITIAQDEATSVIFGMNKIAVEKGYADKVLAIDKIAGEVLKNCEG
jgi:two-component system, chemotaxis family, protein-glutamate methylesterase/glutaminase